VNERLRPTAGADAGPLRKVREPMSPSVCVIIPTYNQAHLVGRAIDSVLQQTYPNLVVVVADDGSTDDTERVVRLRLGDPRLQYRRNEFNRGRVGNYRHALTHHAQAEWVLNLDGDDFFINPGFIADAIAAVQRHGAGQVLFVQGRHVSLDHEPDPDAVVALTRAGQETVLDAGQYFLRFFKTRYFSHLTTLYRRDAALAAGFYEADALSVDMYSVLKLCLCHPAQRVILSETVSAVWFQHGHNSSKSASFAVHLHNFRLLSRLPRIARQRGLGRLPSMAWLGRLVLFSALVYASSVWRRLAR
jgi:glycosyltransferase involved in cell wall biosynthesis